MKYTLFFVIAAIFTATVESCETGWTPYGSHCYRFINQVRLNWGNAEAECAYAAPSGKTGHLVVIDSAAENEWVHAWWVSMLSPLSGTSFEYIWIGYEDSAIDGTFVWVTGSSSSYTNWGGRQPDKGTDANCVTMVTKYANDPGKWDDARCGGKRAYVCEYTK